MESASWAFHSGSASQFPPVVQPSELFVDPWNERNLETTDLLHRMFQCLSAFPIVVDLMCPGSGMRLVSEAGFGNSRSINGHKY